MNAANSAVGKMAGRTRLAARQVFTLAGLLLLASALLAACGGDDTVLTRAEVEEIVRAETAVSPPAIGPVVALTEADVEGVVNRALSEMTQPEPGLTRAEVEEIVRAETAVSPPATVPVTALTEADVEGVVNRALSGMTQPEPGLTRAEVEEMVQAAVAGIPRPQPGLTAEEAERIARAAIASIPSRSSPAEYTQHVVDGAISRYETQGLDATLSHYNRPESVDGQWYVFIIDENDLVVAHPNADRLGLDLKGWVGTDANGYEFGPEMLSADRDGRWVSYVYRNPESGDVGTGDFELKNVWVVRHDGLLFASGWYIDADAFTEQLVSVAVDRYRELGLSGTMAYFASPGSVLAGLEAAIGYYNSAETIDGRWFAFIGDPDGRIVGHSDPSMIGGDVRDLFGGDTVHAHEKGEWVESESLRVFVAGYDGHLFGTGWSRDQ